MNLTIVKLLLTIGLVNKGVTRIIISLFKCVISVLTALELFEGDEHTFQCDHGIPMYGLAKVVWNVAGDTCAGNDMGRHVKKTAKRIWYCDRLKGRATLTPTNLTISDLQTTEDGEIKCEGQDDWHSPIEGNSFNVTIKGEKNINRYI